MTDERTHIVSTLVKKNLLQLGISENTRLLLGVSGGVDSMVLLHVIHQLGYHVSAAHVNFNLRGPESDNDAIFVKKWCLDQGISHYELSKETTVYAEENSLNTQTAARNIRYEWWDFLVQIHHFDKVVTAHHLDDSIETVFLNLLRGTGLKGMKGIPRQRDFYIRPMIENSRKEIEDFASLYSIPFRTDSTNPLDDYKRNQLRHHLIPLLNEWSPGFYSSMKHTLHRIQVEWDAWENSFDQWKSSNITLVSDGFQIQSQQADIPFVLRWLEDKGIPWNLGFDFITSDKSDSGQLLNYENVRLSRTSTGFYFEEKQASTHFVIPGPGQYAFGNLHFTLEAVPASQFVKDTAPEVEYISGSVVQWPLHIRNVVHGDSFQPIGMQGQHKKIQDLLVDHKLEMFEKERVLLLTNQTDVIWVMGYRLDERAKVKPGDQEIYKLTFISADR